jgi:hypothetical protein
MIRPVMLKLSLPSAAMISEDGSPFTVASAVHDGSVIRSVVAQVSKSCVQKSDLGVNASSILEVEVQKRLT